jgi:ATP/maltotriose-dependent transcriptional regulator MalT
VTSFGSRAFLKLGRDDDAFELSRIAVSPEQKTEKKTTLVSCHSILGQVAVKRGDLDEAESHFANALKEAKLSRLPMLEVLAARDWKKHLLEPKGRDASEAEEAIDAACEKMNKARGELASVLEEGVNSPGVMASALEV